MIRLAERVAYMGKWAMKINNLFMKVTGKDHFGSCACMAGLTLEFALKICDEDAFWVQLAQARISLSGMERSLLRSSNSTT